MIDLQLKKSILDLRDLPTLPEVVSQIVKTLEDDNASASDVGRILEMDHAISARILRVANSAFYGASRGIDIMKRAVVVVGFERVRLLAMATSVFDAFSKLDQRSLNPTEFWMHSFGTARAALSISRVLGGPATPETCFTGGLLHDMGKYVLALAYGDRYTRVLASARETGCALDDVERTILQTTHGEVGAWVARRWNFPERLCELVAQTDNYRSHCGPFQKEVRIVACSDQLSCLAGFGCAGSAFPTSLDELLIARLGLTSQFVEDFMQELSAARTDTERLLGQMREG